MRSIWKYALEITDEIELKMPCAAKVLTVQMQGNTPTLWAVVNPDEPLEIRRFRIFATGQPLQNIELMLTEYVGTFQHGGFVGHLFEEA